jgi:hypothetical protein
MCESYISDQKTGAEGLERVLTIIKSEKRSFRGEKESAYTWRLHGIFVFSPLLSIPFLVHFAVG